MISENAGTGEDPNVYNQQGFLETSVDWDALMQSHLSLGYDYTLDMDMIQGVVPVEIYYTFDYVLGDLMKYSPTNINITQAIVSFNGQKIVISGKSGEETDLLYRFKEDFEDVIVNDIQNDAANLELPEL